MKPAIVVAAYNRPDALERLLGSISRAHYEEEDIPLIISIDNSGSRACLEVAERFAWEHGAKIISAKESRMGLKAHLLSCGDLSLTYGSAIILEDDLYVAEDFYRYAARALEFSSRDERVGGVSLYCHLFHVFTRLPFRAIDDGYDNYYLQFASSWGQAVTAGQWQGFKDWLAGWDGRDLHTEKMPDEVASWSSSSWLKYHIRYLTETGKYFLYPRESYTTNFSDEGEHARKKGTELQVPLAGPMRREPVFSGLSESASVYDAFFENEALGSVSDLYGLKRRQGKLPAEGCVYSMEALPYQVKASFGLSMRPQEANILQGVPGDEIRLYDLSAAGQAPSGKGGHTAYYYRGLNRRKIWDYVQNTWNLS